jgi:hypothetical protein
MAPVPPSSVRSVRCALPVFLPVNFPELPPTSAVPISDHQAFHSTVMVREPHHLVAGHAVSSHVSQCVLIHH